MSLTARIMIIGGLTLFCAGAAYLMISRAPAIMIDLSNSAAQLFCL